uniref:Putative zinc finger ccch domain-containing protein 18-like isoform x2 n=1 Tax=Xenopsylla cheopis TaxID=163159 RepID=A0A6M2DT82_XENCH
MESEDSQDVNSRDCASSASSSSYEDDCPASPTQNSRPESRSDDADSANDRSGSIDKPGSPSDNSIERPDSWNAQNENSVDGPASPADSAGNENQPKSPYSSENDEANSLDGPMSPKSDNDEDKEPMSPDHCSAKSLLSNQSSTRRSRSNSSNRSVSNSPRRSMSNSPRRSMSNSPRRSMSNSPRRSRSNSPRRSISNSGRSRSNSQVRSRSNSPDRSRSNSPRRSRSNSPKSGKSSHSGNRSRNSESSSSSRDSSRSRSRPPEPPTEEISDCEMDSDRNSDNEDNSYSNQKSIASPASVKSSSKITENNLNMSHEDLSDVSDLDSAAHSEGEDDKEPKSPVQAPQMTDLRQKLDEAKKQNNIPEKPVSAVEEPKQQVVPMIMHKSSDDAEEALDFEAEEGECPVEIAKIETNGKSEDAAKANAPENDGEIEEGEELEEGEVTDGEENRPEETEPRPVCRFFARGQCTWGVSCRFLHPGVTDKGNYTMFDMVRPVAAGPPGHAPPFGMHHDFRTERPVHMFGPPGRPVAIAGEPPVVESAWERGLRTAKEMMRKANKRKEQDMDFEEKKMNLTIGQDEIERENGYYARAAASPPRALSPEIPYLKPRHIPHDRKEEYFRRHYDEARVMRMEAPMYDDIALHERERMPRYRELPSHRMPQYEEDELLPPEVIKRRSRPAREVIVQRAEPIARGDEWADPWMRSKSPGSRRPKERTARRSYSSGSSYSSSSSSSSTKSRSPQSRSPHARGIHHSSGRRRARASPSIIVSERRAASERALLMNPPAPSPRKRPHSPAMLRRHAQNPPAPASTSKSSNSKSKINRDQTDAFGRVRRDIERISERNRRDSLTSSSKGSRKSPYKRDSRDSRRRDGRSASSNSGSSDSSSSDSGSSYTSSSSSHERSPVSRRLGDSVRLHAMERSRARVRSPMDRKREDSRKIIESSRKRPANSPPEDKSNKSPNGPKKASRREELLKQLKAVEDAIARKRSKND